MPYQKIDPAPFSVKALDYEGYKAKPAIGSDYLLLQAFRKIGVD